MGRRYNYYRKCPGCKGMTFVMEDDGMCPDCIDEKMVSLEYASAEKGRKKRKKELGITLARWEVDKLIKNLPDNERERG